MARPRQSYGRGVNKKFTGGSHAYKDRADICILDRVLANSSVCSLSVPGQPGKFKVGRVTDTSIELTWEPAYTKEGIVNYELLYKPVRFGSLVRTCYSLLINPFAE